MSDKGYTFKKKEVGKLQVELEVEVGGKLFKQEKEHAFEHMASEVEITGFRKGKAPKNLVEAKLGPKLFEHTIEHILPELTVQILNDEKLVPITQVAYKVIKVSDDGLTYTATFSLYPEIKLGDYSKINLKQEKVEVNDEEVEKVMKQMMEDYKKKEEAKNDEKKDSRAVSSKTDKKVVEVKMDDEWASKMDPSLKTLTELKEKVKVQLGAYKERASRDRYITDIVVKALDLSKIEIPEALVEQELDRREADYKNRIENLGLKLDDYLKSQKTTMEELKKEWAPDAEKKIKIELLLIEIGRQKDLKVEDSEVSKEISAVQDEKLREFYASERGKNYIRSVILQQKAINYLLDLIEKKKK